MAAKNMTRVYRIQYVCDVCGETGENCKCDRDYAMEHWIILPPVGKGIFFDGSYLDHDIDVIRHWCSGKEKGVKAVESRWENLPWLCRPTSYQWEKYGLRK